MGADHTATVVFLCIAIVNIFTIIIVFTIPSMNIGDIWMYNLDQLNTFDTITNQQRIMYECCSKKYLQWSHTGDWVGAGISHFTRSLTCALSDAYLTNRTFIFYVNKSTDHTYHGSHPNMSLLGFYDMYNIKEVDAISITDFQLCPCYNQIISDMQIVGDRSRFDRMPQITWNRNSAYLYRIVPDKSGQRAWFHVCDTPVNKDKTTIEYVDLMARNRIWPPLNTDIYHAAKTIHHTMNNSTDFVCAHVRRGDKLAQRQYLDRDTKPQNIFETISALYPNTVNNTEKLYLYIASNEYKREFFDQSPLNEHFNIVNMECFRDIINAFLPIYHTDNNILREAVLDSYICEQLSTYFVETFNDLTHECTDAVYGHGYCPDGNHVWLHQRSGTWMFKKAINHKEHWWEYLKHNRTYFQKNSDKPIQL
eukprot:129368_1